MTNALLNPNFTAGPTGLQPCYPWSVAYLDGILFVVNGFDTNRFWDGGSNFFLMGSVAPADFTPLSLTGAPGTAIPTGTTARYYLVGYDPIFDMETAPQAGAYTSIANASGITKDVVIPWTPGSLAANFTKRRIYRALDGTDDVKLVATVADSAGTYTDVTPDASLATAVAYVPTYRTTLPPIFAGISTVASQMWGWQTGSARAFYAQPVNLGYTFVGQDFKADQFVTIGAADNRGDIVHLVERYGSAIWYKQRARYEMTGSDILTWEFRKLNGDRGLISQRCLVDIDGDALCLDERGLYWDSLAYDPRVAGAGGGKISPLQPIWDRMNLGAARWFFAIHDPASRLAFFCIALDYEPVPNVAVVFDYATDTIVGIDTLVWTTAGGVLYDAAGRIHLMFACDLGYLWEIEYGATQGVTAGTTTAVVTGNGLLSVAASAASFDTGSLTGPIGCPLQRRGTTSLLVVDANRVYTNSATTLTTYYFPANINGASETVAVGVIAGKAALPKFCLTKDGENFDVKEVEFHLTPGVSGNLDVWTAVNEEGYVLKSTQAIPLATKNHNYVSGDGGCWTWSIQFTQTDANLGFSLRSIAVHYREFPGRRLP